MGTIRNSIPESFGYEKNCSKINIDSLHENCLLCSEHTPERCHRRLLAEYLKQVKNTVEIIHLIRC
ncbi:DUF488 family protein [Verminephrobacter eiseniae]|uniref:DUF488 family protein n=1 Tax=Verminephrobacter eiseniae TaxID=364317 RepID=UPI0038B2D330